MKKKPVTWVTVEASQALTEWMATLHQGVLKVAEARQQRKNAGVCLELSDLVEAMPVACQTLLEVIEKQASGKSEPLNQVA